MRPRTFFSAAIADHSRTQQTLTNLSASHLKLRKLRRLQAPVRSYCALPSILDGHAVDVVVLEIVAGRFRLLLAEPGEAGAVQDGFALAHALGEGAGARQKPRRLGLHRARTLLGFDLRRQGADLDHPADVGLRLWQRGGRP